jgi:plasmid maintenance system antidote protein VapI
MTPNAERYNPSTDYADKLISQIGQTPSWIAKRIGVTDKRIKYILEGERTVKGETTAIQMTYTEQFALECLAAEAKALKK